MPPSGLLEGLTVFSENTGLVVGRTLVDPSGWKVPVLVSNFGQDTVMVEPFSEIGMIAQVTAIQPVMDKPSRSPVDPSMLPEHLRDLLDRTSEGLEDLQRGRLAETLLEFVDLFPVPGSALTGHTEAVEHTIDTGDSLPIRCALRRMSPQKIKQEEACVEEMLASGQVEPSDSPWSAPVVLVTKKDGGTRFCVDSRRLNLVTVKDAYPLPRIGDTLDMLAGKRWFSTLDLASGYWQVSLSPDARCKTFRTLSVQSHAVRTLQRTGHLREVNGSSSARITMVPLPGVFGRHYLFRDDVRRCTGQPDIDFWASALLWTAIEINKVSSVPDVCAFSGTCGWQGRTAVWPEENRGCKVLAGSGLFEECAAVPWVRGILQTVYLQFCRHGGASGLIDPERTSHLFGDRPVRRHLLDCVTPWSGHRSCLSRPRTETTFWTQTLVILAWEESSVKYRTT